MPTNDTSIESSIDALEEKGSMRFISLPIVLSTLDTVEIKFGTTTSVQKYAIQNVCLILVEGIKEAIEKANNHLLDTDKIKSMYIRATTNGKHASDSNHYHGAAAGISRINDEKMALSGVIYQIIQLQNAFDEYT